MLRLLCRVFHVGSGVNLPPPARRCEAGGGAGPSSGAQEHSSSMKDCRNVAGAHKHLRMAPYCAGAVTVPKTLYIVLNMECSEGSRASNCQNTLLLLFVSIIDRCVHMSSPNASCMVRIAILASTFQVVAPLAVGGARQATPPSLLIDRGTTCI